MVISSFFRRNGILVAALFAAVFSVQQAAAWGAYIPHSVSGAPLLAVAEYDTEAEALDAIHTACVQIFLACIPRQYQYETFENGVVVIGTVNGQAAAAHGDTFADAHAGHSASTTETADSTEMHFRHATIPNDRIVCADGTGNDHLESEGVGENCTRQFTSGGNSDDADAAGYFGYAGIALFFAALYWDGGGFANFGIAPDFNYNITESGYSAKAGGRMDFAKENIRLYWKANQTNRSGDFGDFRYTSGGEYKTDIWKATFSESVAGETADYNFALSANFGGENGIWKLSPTYRIHSRFDENESASEMKSETRNSLNLESELRYHRWTIKPSAGFSWQNENDFGDNARFRLNAIHRF